MHIRRARPSDARAFAALARHEIEVGLPHGWTAARVARLLARPDTNAYALVEATAGPGEARTRAEAGLGGFSIARFDLEHGHLMLHAIAPGLRRRGFGRELLEWQLRAARTAGLTRLSLEVRARDDIARRFYTAFGFRAGARLPRYYAGREDALRMLLEPLPREGRADEARPPSGRRDGLS